MNRKIILCSIFFIFFAHSIIFAAPIIDIQNVKGLILDLIFDKEKNTLTLNPQNINPINFAWESKILPQSGSFFILIKDSLGKEIYRSPFSLFPGKNELFIPYFLNIEEIDILKEDNQLLLNIPKENFIDIQVCNENNTCEDGEEVWCSKDCSTAQNPFYPLAPQSDTAVKNFFQKQNQEKLLIPTYTTSTARKATSLNLWLLGGAIITLTVLLMSISWYNKK